MQIHQKTDSHLKRRADALAEAIEQRQIAARAAIQWQEILDKTGDRYTQRYLEGQVELSKLRVLHHNLVAQSCQRSGNERAPSSFNLASEGKFQTVDHEPPIRENSSLEIALARKGRDKALSECDIHHAKAIAFTILGDRCRELGMERRAGIYEARAGRESAAARGFDNVIRAYGRKLEELGVRTILRAEVPDLHKCFGRLENAERCLEDYNIAHARAMALMRQALECDPAIQKLKADSADQPLKPAQQKQFHELADHRDLVGALAEKEAIGAALSYKSFQKEIQSAQADYERLAHSLTKPPDPTKAAVTKHDFERSERSETLHDTKGDLQGPGRIDTEKKISDTTIKEPEKHTPEHLSSRSGSNHPAISEQHPRRITVGPVVGAVLKEMDREI